MKRIFALLLMISFAAAFFASSPGKVNASVGQIYEKNSTGPMVVRIQLRLRELGYLCFKPTGSYKSMTVNAVKAFQTNYRDTGFTIQADGRAAQDTVELMFKPDALRVTLSGISIPSGPKHGSSSLVKTGSLLAWDSVKSLMTIGRSYTITDCYTGSTFDLVYTGGENHAEMEPASEQALAGFMEICGREFNYLKRPVLVSLNGQDVAASIQCWPHGSRNIADSGMEGHVCLFFDGSSSHVGSFPDVEHTENIYKAAGQ